MSKDPLLGTVVAGYKILAILGVGATGTVYDAERAEHGTRVALKVLRSQTAEVAARFLREGKTLSLFEHRNVVELLDAGRIEDDGLFLATELVRGISLRALLDDGPVEPRRALAIMRQVLEALGHAHDLGVIHRDIKPENIMLVDGGDPGGDSELVKILDFGVAKLIGDTAALLDEGKLTQTGFACLGTPLYMAPELVLGRTVDGRCDLYAAGAVLFEMLAGKPPFDDEDPVAVMRSHASRPLPPLREVAPERSFTPQLEYVVSDAMAKQADLRFRSAADMIAALDAAVLSLEPIAEPAPPHPTLVAPVPPPPPARRAPTSTPIGGASIRAQTHPPAGLVAGPYTAPSREALPHVANRRRRPMVLAAWGLAALAVVALAASRGGDGRDVRFAKPQLAGTGPRASEPASRARELVAAGSAASAVEYLERTLASSEAYRDAPAFLALGHARAALGQRLDALAAFERATEIEPAIGSDAELRVAIAKVLESQDAVASVIALELLATRVSPPDHATIVTHASFGKLADVRHRAFAIAEREGFAEKIDRVESWSLDLLQQADCDRRRLAIAKLRSTGERRAIPALRRVRSLECTAKAAKEAISHLEATR